MDVDVPALAEQPACTPFDVQMVSISKEAYIQLKWEANYWRTQFSQLAAHRDRDVQHLKEEMAQRDKRASQALSEIKAALDKARARVEDLQKRLFSRKSEKSQGGSEKRSGEPDIKRPRGQRPARPWACALNAPAGLVNVPEINKCCACCGLPLAPLPGTQASEVIEQGLSSHHPAQTVSTHLSMLRATVDRDSACATQDHPEREVWHFGMDRIHC